MKYRKRVGYPVRKADTLKRMIFDSCRRFGSCDAFISRDGAEWNRISYAGFLEDVEALGTALFSAGLSDRTFILSGENGIIWATVFAAAAGGLGPVFPLPAGAGTETVADACGLCAKPALVVADREISGLPDGTDVITFDRIPDLIAEGNELISRDVTGYTALEPAPGDAALIMRCRPGKAAVFSQERICASVDEIAANVFADQSDVVMAAHSWSGAYSLIFGLLYPLSRGAAVAVARGLRTLVQDMKQTRPTMLCAVPGLVSAMYGGITENVRGMGRRRERLVRVMTKVSHGTRRIGKHFFGEIWDTFGGRLRVIFCGPGICDEDAVRGLRSLGFRPVQTYGPSGSMPLISMNGDVLFRDGTAGCAAPGSVIDLYDIRSDGTGRIRYKGPGCPSGFLTASGFEPAPEDGWYYTGDSGSIDPDGYIRVRVPAREEEPQ